MQDGSDSGGAQAQRLLEHLGRNGASGCTYRLSFPEATSGERLHRGLARCLETVRRMPSLMEGVAYRL